jgi:hypothetical protein
MDLGLDSDNNVYNYQLGLIKWLVGHKPMGRAQPKALYIVVYENGPKVITHNYKYILELDFTLLQ